MKTKEIDVWINRENIKADNPCLIDLYTDLNKYKREYYGEPIKAKLVIPLPEKKIELTADQIEDAMYTTDIKVITMKKVLKELGF